MCSSYLVVENVCLVTEDQDHRNIRKEMNWNVFMWKYALFSVLVLFLNTVEFQRSWWIATDKTVTNFGIRFQYRIPIWFQ
jgi:hypothetical protein